MSGTVTSNTLRSSGVIAATAAGLNWVSTPVTASTVTVESGNGYWINTTSNAITITLPSSAEKGDQIILIDYLRTWGTNAITIDSNGLNYQGEDDSYTVEYTTSGQSLNIVYSDATKGWIPLDDDVAAFEPVAPPTQRAIFAYGSGASAFNISNLVNSSGVVGSDVTGVGTARAGVAATAYGTDKAIFGWGDGSPDYSITNLVNNSGVVSADVTGVGTGKRELAGATYGSSGQAIFAYGNTGSAATGNSSVKNLVSNTGVVSDDATGVGTARHGLAATSFGSDKAIFAYGSTASAKVSMSNIVSNVGVVASDVSGVGTARMSLAAASYGGDKGLFGYGLTSGNVSLKNLVGNTGIIAADVTGVGSARRALMAAAYGGDKAIFAYGYISGVVSLSNLVSNSGVVAADVTGVGSARISGGGAGYSLSA